MSIVPVRRALALSACLLLAACGASPTEPAVPAAPASAQTTVAPTAQQGGGMPWYQATTAAPAGGGMPWY
jgi:outer membrane biogenesis lipoprotein LolB